MQNTAALPANNPLALLLQQTGSVWDQTRALEVLDCASHGRCVAGQLDLYLHSEGFKPTALVPASPFSANLLIQFFIRYRHWQAYHAEAGSTTLVDEKPARELRMDYYPEHGDHAVIVAAGSREIHSSSIERLIHNGAHILGIVAYIGEPGTATQRSWKVGDHIIPFRALFCAEHLLPTLPSGV